MDNPKLSINSEIIEENQSQRDNFWNSIGKVDKDVLSTIINPAFMGKTTWPNMHELYIVIRTKDINIISTDGLSDDLKLELYTETKEENPEQGWPRELVRQVSLNVSDSKEFKSMIDKYGIFSTEVYDVPVPHSFLTTEGRVGVLIGMESLIVPKKLKLTDNSEILYLSLTLLTLRELNYIIKNGIDGRKLLINKLKEIGNNNLSSITRESVI